MKVIYFVMKYPTLSQTFIDREMRALGGQPGISVEVHPILDFRFPRATDNRPVPGNLPVRRVRRWRLLPAAAREASRVLRRHPELVRRGWRLLLAHRPRTAENWFHTFWGTLYALGRARGFRRETGDLHFHGAWATAPATAAAVLGTLCDRPWSFGAHAYDLYRDGGDAFLAPKLASAHFVHTTTLGNARFLETNFPGRRAPVVLARRGLLEMPPGPLPPRRLRRVGRNLPLNLLGVGRLVEKKGFRHALAGVAELTRRGVDVRFRILGDGPLLDALRQEISRLGLADHVELPGAVKPAEVWDAYAWTDVFLFTGVVDAAGDRDGLPNVVPEAMSLGLPVIAGREAGVGEAVRDHETGLVVDVTDPVALADAIERLRADPDLRARLGTVGRAWVEEHYLAPKNTARLAEAIWAASGWKPPPAG